MKKLALLAALCGCVSVPMARRDLDTRAKVEAPPPDAASVYVYRPRAFVGTAVGLAVFLDDVRVGVLAPSTFTVSTVRPGEHKLVSRRTAYGDESAERTIVVEPGRTYFVKTTLGLGLSGFGVSLELVQDDRAARDDLRSCGLVASPAADAIRGVAAEIGKVNVDGVAEETLLAASVRALTSIEGDASAASAADLDEVLARVRASHPSLDDRQLLFTATRAMLELFQSQGERAAAAERAVDEACGLVLRRDGRGSVVAGVLPDSPAARAGLAAGLEVRELNGQPMGDHAPPEVAQLLAGDPGTDVYLTLGMPGEVDRKVSLKRAPADPGRLDCRVLAGRVLYLRPVGLRSATARRVRDQARAAGDAARLVLLDLRDNAGGPVDAARDLADSFLAEGRIMTVTGARISGIDKEFVAARGTSELEQARLVVLVNGHTAGSAETVAAAIQDARRGAVLGTKTQGMGTVDVLYTVRGITLPLPMAHVVRPGGAPIEGLGVTPDAPADAAAPVPVAAPSDVACTDVVSAGSVADDALVRRAAALLMSAPAP